MQKVQNLLLQLAQVQNKTMKNEFKNWETKRLRNMVQGMFELLYIYEVPDEEVAQRYELALIELDKRGEPLWAN